MDKRPVHPYSKASVFSKYFFWWLVELLRTGQRRQIGTGDIYQTLSGHRSEKIGARFSAGWLRQVQLQLQQKKKIAESVGGNGNKERHRPWRLLKVVFKIYGPSVILFGGIYSWLESACRIAQPFLLGQLILYFDQADSSPISEAYLYAGGLVLTVVAPLAIFHLYQLFLLQVGMKLRIGCCALIYQKALQLTTTLSADGLSGRIINLMSNDVSRFDYAIIFLNDLWKGPVELVIVSVLVYRLIGPTGLIGIAILLLFIPGQAWLGKQAASFRLKTAMATDERVKFTNEVIQAIQVIKMYVWERPFEQVVHRLRRDEIRALRGSAFIRSGLFALKIIPKISIFASLVAYVYAGNALTAMKVYMLVSFFSVINHTMVEYWPLAVTSCAEAWVSLKRIEEFLDEEGQMNDDAGGKEKLNCGEGIEVKEMRAEWAESNFRLRLNEWTVRKGQTWAVIGQIGSGKSSILNLVMKELTPKAGSVTINGTVSYCSQKPWVFEGTVRENIVFIEPFDENRYNKVVRVCALQRDLKLWPNGDQTVVGERGVSLSGGQKARVNLARAIYRRADIYLLDDPLSAVDAHVGKQIYDECIQGFLGNKICILVTHQLQYLNGLDHILIMKDGEIEAKGCYEEVRDYFKNIEQARESTGEDSEELTEAKPLVDDDENREDMPSSKVEETQNDGNVGFKVYKDFLKSVNSSLFVALVALLLLAWQTSSTGIDYFLSIWVNWEEQYSDSADATWSTDTHVLLYTSLIVLTLVLSINSFAFFEMCLRASLHLHAALYRGISRATMYFFNNNSSGRVINRFSKDIGLIDASLPVVMIDSLYFFLELTGIIVVVSLANYWLLGPTAVMAVLFYILRFMFLKTARNVKRVEAITRSPIFAHTNATVEGLVTVRVFRAQRQMMTQFDARQDLNSSASFLFGAITRGFAFWLDLICTLYIAAVVFSFPVLGREIVSGNVGLAITQVLNLIGMCNWGLRQTAELENQMTSVERVLEYSRLEEEDDEETPSNDNVPEKWPQEGGIVFRNVSLRYSPQAEPVLRELTFEIKAKERIGIVGRTGAGKSSIIQALFRLAPIDQTDDDGGGTIEIDRIAIGAIPLRRLRAAISIIPQEPAIFSGSLRTNLDPFGALEDDRIWQALAQVELKELVSSYGAAGLETKMVEGGANFSVGQRQLICLARAILRDSRILILDEATASVDPETDRLIQSTIRHQFRECTILTIAHRLHTIMDSDRVLVMDAGRTVEFDSPANLLLNRYGYFRKLFDETGMDVNRYI
ncbi:ATP-binding cassette sub-family C member 4-like [Ochlerotatus camptorhynchus]|uniref:ATP-binding cassette sub-family C member 4-like n=1 Tax=Ochlerotatus camptorhynchus TaxID=644619 RepID=UPI0031D6EEE6